MRRVGFVLILGFFAVLQGFAQDVSVRLRSDSTHILIGEWFPAAITVEAPKDYRIVFPVEDGGFLHAAYVESDSAQHRPSGAKSLYSKAYTLTSFDTGVVAVSATITYFKPGDTTAYFSTSNEIDLEVVTVRIDTAGSFKDIKEVLEVPYSWWDYVLFISAVFAAGMLLWFGWHRWKYRAAHEAAAMAPEPEPAIPPEIIAMEKLRALEQKKLWEQGQHKEYQSELTDTLREYIEGKFTVPALEETTPEIIGHLNQTGIDLWLVQEVEIALRCADLTKFAKYEPDPVAHRQGLKTAYLFVEETKSYRKSVEEESRMMKPAIDPAPEPPRLGEPSLESELPRAIEPPRPGEPPVETERSDDDVRS